MVETVTESISRRKVFFWLKQFSFVVKYFFFFEWRQPYFTGCCGGMVTGGEDCAERGAVPKAGFGWSSRSGRKTKTERQRAAEGDLQMEFAPNFFNKFNFMIKYLYNLKLFDIFYEKATQN